MAIVSMQKMSIVAHASERSKMLRIFLKSGCVEVVKTQEFDHTQYVNDDSKRANIQSKLLKVSFALTFLRERSKEMAKYEPKNTPKVNMKKENRLVDIDEYYNIVREEVEIFSKISEMEKLNGVFVDIKTEKSRLNALREQLLVYRDLEIPFSEIKDSNNTAMLVGTVPAAAVQEIADKLPEDAELTGYDGDKLNCIVIICHKKCLGEIINLLSGHDFIKCGFNFPMTAGLKISEIDNKLIELNEKTKRNVIESMSFADMLSTLKVAYDYYNLEIAKLDCMAKCPRSQKAFALEAWVPKDRAKELEDKLTDKCKKMEIAFRDPNEDELPPTMVNNAKVVQPFEGITDMFGAPNYREADPNIFVALFYFLFFGIMISDAGYGLLMAIACFTIVKLTKPVKQSGRMMIMFGFCGISTVIWGALFGGWFGVESAKLPAFLQAITWFNPLEDPLKMFMLALGMGVLQIGTGFALKGIAMIKSGEAVKGILNNFSWVVIFIGLILISPSLMIFLGAIRYETVPPIIGSLSTVGKYVAIAGFALLLIGGAVGKKNPVKMVTGMFGNAYGAINVVSDLLSYSRLFGLGLTTGVIGYVINMLADIIVNTFFGGLWVGWIIAVPVLIFGHAFNLAINLLGAYVHNSRLQYIEFFGRFYEGNGHAFAPLGSKTKYTYLDN